MSSRVGDGRGGASRGALDPARRGGALNDMERGEVKGSDVRRMIMSRDEI